MKIEAILAELEQVAKQLGIRVSYEALGGELGSGGLCKVKGEWRVIVDKRATPGERLSLLGEALVRFPLTGLTLSPAAANLIDKSRPLRVGDRAAAAAAPAVDGPAPVAVPETAETAADSGDATPPPPR